LLDGLPLDEWELHALHQRVGVIFQDFGRYQFSVGENIGSGDVRHYDDRERWYAAADTGMALPFIERMDAGFDTQLGRWFEGGRELSGGQWQKIALSRAFMRRDADILILDEPTAAMDAAAEVQVFDHFRATSRDKITILISHRFSTVRAADHIVVIDQGHIAEAGNHDELMRQDGQYARLFNLQARGYR
jgi:ATP-binding cassette subfamily B protein